MNETQQLPSSSILAVETKSTVDFTGDIPCEFYYAVLKSVISVENVTSGVTSTTESTNYTGASDVTYTEASTNNLAQQLTIMQFNDLQFVNQTVNIRSCMALTTINFPELLYINGNIDLFNCRVITNLLFPKLKVIKGSFNMSAMPLLTSISFPELTTIMNLVNPTTMTGLTTLSMPKLKFIGGGFTPNLSALTSFNFPELETIGGAGFAPLTASACTTISLPKLKNVSIYTHPTLNAAMTILSLPSLQSCYTGFTCISKPLTSISLPSLLDTGIINITSNASLTNVSLDSLVRTYARTNALGTVDTNGNFNISSSPLLATLTLQSLVQADGTITITGSNVLTTLELPSLTTALKTVTIGTMSSLLTLNMPVIATLSGTSSNLSLTVTSTASLRNVTLGSDPTTPTGLKSVASGITITGNLSQASVDHILTQLAALDGTNGTTAYSSQTITLSGGTNEAPSATGLAAKVILLARSCTVLHN